MRRLLLFLILSIVASGCATNQSNFTSNTAVTTGNYAMVPEVQLGYPSVKITNPDGSDAIYDGIALKGNLNLPLLYDIPFDIYLTPGLKYIDLENLANNSAQYESANIIGPGVGLSFQYSKFWFGAQYYYLWARHFSNGAFNDRTRYSMNAIEYFGGLYFQFGRLGLGVSYSRSFTKIDKTHTGLNSNSPYDESIYGVQATFDTGISFWEFIKSLF